MKQSMQVLTSHETEEWYTPPELLELVREVIGPIDLDPASSKLAQTIVKARKYFDLQHNALERSWNAGSVFLNPPYGKEGGESRQGFWTKRMVYEYRHFERGLLIINSTHGYVWYEHIWKGWPVCCLRERVRFIRLDDPYKPGLRSGESWFNQKLGLIRSNQAKRGQTFVYFGDNRQLFKQVFRRVGRVLMPSQR